MQHYAESVCMYLATVSCNMGGEAGMCCLIWARGSNSSCDRSADGSDGVTYGWLLQGSSEWQYAWVPFSASLCGGVAAAGIYSAINKLNHSNI